MKTLTFLYEDTTTGEKLSQSINSVDVANKSSAKSREVLAFLDLIEAKMDSPETQDTEEGVVNMDHE